MLELGEEVQSPFCPSATNEELFSIYRINLVWKDIKWTGALHRATPSTLRSSVVLCVDSLDRSPIPSSKASVRHTLQ